MEKMKMVEMLREKADITMEEAKDILERNDWDLLNAMVELEKEGKMKQAEEKAAEETASEQKTEEQKAEEQKADQTTAHQQKRARCQRLREAAKNLVRMGIDNKFLVNKGEEVVVKVPVILPIACAAASFWTTAIVLLVGMVFGLRYSFEGKQLGKEVINKTMVKASEATNEFVTNLAEKKTEEVTEQ